jgi:hypothetical protein
VTGKPGLPSPAVLLRHDVPFPAGQEVSEATFRATMARIRATHSVVSRKMYQPVVVLHAVGTGRFYARVP